MIVYFVSDTRRSRYCATLAEAKAEAKQQARFDTLIEQVEVGTDRANMLRLLNSEGGTDRVLRQWELTLRGGLREIPTNKGPAGGSE